jgi:DHA1 family purine ribonucleoside efflux pump-like MFS transporter
MIDSATPRTRIGVAHVPALASSGASGTVASGAWDARTRLSLGALTFTVFSLVLSEFLPTGLLTPMAADLGVSEGIAGQTMTATAVAGMLSALLIGLVIRSADRRMVMLALSVLALLGNAISVVALDITVLLAARAAVGVAIGGFWALSTGVVGRLVSTSDIGRAMGIIIIGVSVATIAAPPAGAFVALRWGWRIAMVAATVASLVAVLAQAIALPRLPAVAAVNLRSLLEVARRRMILTGLLAVIAIAGGHFAGFTYIRPVLQNLAGLGSSAVAAVLLAFGLSNFVGNLVGAALVDRHLRFVLGAATGLVGLSALGTFLLGGSVVAVIALLCLWGFGFGGAPIALQTWMARSAADQLESVGSIFISTFQIAIAVGAFAGGAIVDEFGISAALLFTGALALLAALVPVCAGPGDPE